MRKGLPLAGLSLASSVALWSAATAVAEPATKNAPQPPVPAEATAAPTAQRNGVRIEIKVPEVPGLTVPAQSKSWPKTLPEAEAEKEAAGKPPAAWPAEEVAAAKARCTAILKRIHAIAIPEEPIKDGICGTPAPIQLISIGKNPEVALSPPAIVNCEFAEALQTWMDGEVQPLAKKHLGTNIIKIEVMSSYSCRNAYGRAGNRLSEHALANALDIRGFVTASGKTAYVLEDWGTPQREILARLAAEKARAAKALAAAEAAEKARTAEAEAVSKTAKVQPATKPDANAAIAKAPPAAAVPDEKTRAARALAEAEAAVRSAEAAHRAAQKTGSITPRITPRLSIAPETGEEDGSGPADQDGEETGFSISPSHLGGPKVQVKVQINTGKAAAADANATGSKPAATDGTRTEAFLHAVHAAACQRFGTTLGPEANAAHRNHFHVDMAPRKSTKICD